ncbi:unnamed protein product, partial [Prorocentrum cordatum]
EEIGIRAWAKTYQLASFDETVLEDGSLTMCKCILVWAAALMLKSFSEQVDKVALRKSALAAQQELSKHQLMIEEISPK